MFVLLPIALLTAGLVFGLGMALNAFGLAGHDARRIPEARRGGWVIVVVCALGLLFTILTAGMR